MPSKERNGNFFFDIKIVILSGILEFLDFFSQLTTELTGIMSMLSLLACRVMALLCYIVQRFTISFCRPL